MSMSGCQLAQMTDKEILDAFMSTHTLADQSYVEMQRIVSTASS